MSPGGSASFLSRERSISLHQKCLATPIFCGCGHGANLTPSDAIVKDLRVCILDPLAQVGWLLPLDQFAKQMGSFVLGRSVSEGDESQLLPGQFQRLPHHEVPIQRRCETGLVLTSLAIEKQWSRRFVEDLHELLQGIGMGKIRGAQVEVVVFDSETGKVDAPIGTIGSEFPAQIDRAADLEPLQGPTESASRCGSTSDAPGVGRIERMQIRLHPVAPDS